METFDYVIIGAGAVGLAIGQRLTQLEGTILVVDKENSFGRHTSSRNSEVIHAGIYYPAGSLKAQLCVEGNKLLYNYLAEYRIPHCHTGKIIVATNPEEEQVIQKYYEQGTANGCEGLTFLSGAEVMQQESRVTCTKGLLVPSSGIFDTHAYMKTLCAQIEEQGGFVVFGMELLAIQPVAEGYLLSFANGEQVLARWLINSGGMWSDQLAAMAGMDTEQAGLKLHWCKGEYYKVTKIKGVQRLIYPVADPMGIFLGIHLTINLNGEARFGPNAFYVDDISYKFHEEYLDDFYQSIQRYFQIDREDLLPDDTGIRPKLQGPTDPVRDFYIQEESGRGLPRLINLIGIESPGLTASLSIADYVSFLIKTKEKNIC